MTLDQLTSLQKFMARVTLVGAECNEFAGVMNAIVADTMLAQKQAVVMAHAALMPPQPVQEK